MTDQTPETGARDRLMAQTEAIIAKYRARTESDAVTADVARTVPAGSHEVFGSHKESTPATEITIDLPHGQALTIRGLEPGAVVEIASWTGTGPPDEDALRMMFGASRASAAESSDTASTDLVKVDSHERDLPESPNTATADQPSDPSGHMEERNGMMWKKVGVLAAVIGAIALAVFGLRVTNIALFVHPDGGLTGGLGAASSTFVAVSPTATIEPNASILVTIGEENLVAGVIQVGPDDTLVFTGDGQEVVKNTDIVGRVLFVVPFIGLLAPQG